VNPAHHVIIPHYTTRKSYHKPKPKEEHAVIIRRRQRDVMILELNHLPQDEVADLLGISQSTVSGCRKRHGVRVDHRSTRHGRYPIVPTWLLNT
jgi:DNA invertase Pin-like site-specific DNA recombinase